MSNRTKQLIGEIRSKFNVDTNNVHGIPLTTNEEKEAFNAAILKKMLDINASFFTEEEKPVVGEIMRFLYRIYDDTIPEHDYSRLSGLAKAFHDKNRIPIMQDDTVIFGPRFVKKRSETRVDENNPTIWTRALATPTEQEPPGPDDQVYRRWGGKKRTHKRKTHVNKSRKNKKKRGNK